MGKISKLFGLAYILGLAGMFGCGLYDWGRDDAEKECMRRHQGDYVRYLSVERPSDTSSSDRNLITVTGSIGGKTFQIPVVPFADRIPVNNDPKRLKIVEESLAQLFEYNKISSKPGNSEFTAEVHRLPAALVENSKDGSLEVILRPK